MPQMSPEQVFDIIHKAMGSGHSVNLKIIKPRFCFNNCFISKCPLKFDPKAEFEFTLDNGEDNHTQINNIEGVTLGISMIDLIQNDGNKRSPSYNTKESSIDTDENTLLKNQKPDEAIIFDFSGGGQKTYKKKIEKTKIEWKEGNSQSKNIIIQKQFHQNKLKCPDCAEKMTYEICANMNGDGGADAETSLKCSQCGIQETTCEMSPYKCPYCGGWLTFDQLKIEMGEYKKNNIEFWCSGECRRITAIGNLEIVWDSLTE